MPIWLSILLILVGLAGGGLAGYMYRKSAVEGKIGRTEEYAKRLYDDAVRKADEYKKEKVLEAKEEILKDKADNDREKAENEREMRENEREIRERRAELQRSERAAAQR